MICIGIDPGWANLGAATITESSFLGTKKLAPKAEGLYETVGLLTKPFIGELDHPNRIVVIERYVAYGGVTNSDSENIIMLIGALSYAFRVRGYDVRLMRAIDWKISLCKHLVKTSDFTNPSAKLDKKFSLAAAEHICGYKLKTDHEADALCLAKYGQLLIDGVIE